MNRFTIARLDVIYPELAKRWREVDQMLTAQGLTIEIDQGLRTWPEQTALWLKGRDAEGNIVEKDKVVTHAHAGESYHNYGLALDFVPEENGQPIWDRSHPAYMKTIEIAESFGLVSGARWPEPKTDFPHLQLTGEFPEDAPDDHCKYIFREGGLSAVWDQVDKSLGVVKNGT